MTPIYLASNEPFTYDRPAVYCFKEKVKECNGLKIPLLVPANTIPTNTYYRNNFYLDEYVLFPRKIFNIEGEIYLTSDGHAVYIKITSKERYRCVGLELKSMIRRVWVPIDDKFFENLLIDQEFSELKPYSIFKDVNGDCVVTGKFRVENGFLELDN